MSAERGFPVAPPPVLRRAVRELLHRHRRRVGVTTALYLVAAGCGLVGPWVVGRIIDAVADGTTVGAINRWGVLLVVALVLQAGFNTLSSRSAMRTGEEVFAELRERFMSAVVRLPLGQVERAGTGDLVTRTTWDVSTVSESVRFGIPDTLLASITVVATVVTALVVDPLVSLAMIVIAGIVPVARWYLRRSPPVRKAIGAGYSGLGDAVSSNATSARDIDLLSLGPVRRDAVDDAVGTLYRARRREIRLNTVLLPSIILAFSLPIVVVLAWGAWLVRGGHTTPGAVATVALYVTQMSGPVDRLIGWLDQFQRGAISLARILGVEEVERPTGVDAELPVGPIEIDGVRFGYRPEHPVLRDISLVVRSGERLAVVGPSGSGKSTLARIVSGIEAPDAGTARLGGVALAGQPTDTLRRAVALVTQENHVFRGTLAENLRMATPGASDEQLREALATIGAVWADALPDGLDTEVGSGGAELTPMQAQHVALARVLLLAPRVVVLDEATAMFDPDSAEATEQALSAALAGHTVISVAHRLHTALDADRVALVVDGRLVELGTHDELLERGGRYAELWKAWTAATP